MSITYFYIGAKWQADSLFLKAITLRHEKGEMRENRSGYAQ